MIRKDYAALSLSRQCRLLKINRLSMYYKPVGVEPETLMLMNEAIFKYGKPEIMNSDQGGNL